MFYLIILETFKNQHTAEISPFLRTFQTIILEKGRLSGTPAIYPLSDSLQNALHMAKTIKEFLNMIFYKDFNKVNNKLYLHMVGWSDRKDYVLGLFRLHM